MPKYIKFHLVAIFFIVLFSCNIKENKSITINFGVDSTEIIISDINDAGLFQLKKNIETDRSYQQLVTVLQTPNENDSTSMEIEWPGKLSFRSNQLIFTPDQPFVKGETYIVETIINTQFASTEDIIKNKIGTQIKPQKQILKR